MRKKTLIVSFITLISVCIPPGSWSQKKSGKPVNIITRENALPGTTNWIITKVTRHKNEPVDKGWHRRKEIEGYVSHMSIQAGDTLNIYVSTDPPSWYKIDIYRMGYYGGKGARLMTTLSPHTGLVQKGITQLTPVDGPFHIIQCNWEVSARLKIPEEWVSGVYLGKLTTFYDVEAEAYFIFIVRDDRKADILFQCSDFTWQSYNRWPQARSIYDAPNNLWNSRQPESYAAGFDRPYGIYLNPWPAGFEPLTNGSGEFLMTEFPLAFWLEKEGYDVSYISQMDVHENGQGLLRGKVYLSVGHDEYLTVKCYENLLEARDAGVNMAFICGNSVDGMVELLPGPEGRPNRGLRYVGFVTGNFDEVELMGATSYGVGFADWTCAAPGHWAFEGTGMKKGDIVPQLVGWEYHGPPLATDYKDFVVLAEGPVKANHGKPTDRTYATTIYTAPKGNYVFNAATIWWSKVLSAPPGYINPPYVDIFEEGDERIRRITKNILDRMIEVQLKE